MLITCDIIERLNERRLVGARSLSYSGFTDETCREPTLSGDGLVERLLAGDRRALARVISKIERGDP